MRLAFRPEVIMRLKFGTRVWVRQISILVYINKTDLTFICPKFRFREKSSYTVLFTDLIATILLKNSCQN